jgi:hypothetical protein
MGGGNQRVVAAPHADARRGGLLLRYGHGTTQLRAA